MFSITEREEVDAKKWTTFEIERLLPFAFDESLELNLAIVELQPAEIENLEFHLRWLLDYLHGLPAAHLNPRTQRFVTADDFGKALFKRRDLQLSIQAIEDRNTVETGAGHQLVQEP